MGLLLRACDKYTIGNCSFHGVVLVASQGGLRAATQDAAFATSGSSDGRKLFQHTLLFVYKEQVPRLFVCLILYSLPPTDANVSGNNVTFTGPRSLKRCERQKRPKRC